LKRSLRVSEVIDLSIPVVNGCTRILPGDFPPKRTSIARIEKDGYSSSVWTLHEHSGTHIDAPSHLLDKGKAVDELSIARCVGKGIALDFRAKPPRYMVQKDDIVTVLKAERLRTSAQEQILLFCTGYTPKSPPDDPFDYPALSSEACEYIVKMRAKAVGSDAPAIDHASPFPAHKILLSNDIAVYENLRNLDRLIHRNFIFVGAPLGLVEGSASPVRALAIMLDMLKASE
jgi:arylformamidase